MLARSSAHSASLAAQLVECDRSLMSSNPAAHELDLAGSLNNLSIWLGEVGRHQEGPVAVEEAVEVSRRLAAANPAAHEPALTTSLNNQSILSDEPSAQSGAGGWPRRGQVGPAVGGPIGSQRRFVPLASDPPPLP